MTIRSLPAAPAGRPCAGVSFDLMPQAMERWNADIQAAAEDDKNTISILDAIGFDPWSGEGVTAKRISAALRSMAGADVTVNVNSPGGDMFEGLAIYNILREYKGHVTIKVLGLAASAASIIAMAGDEIQVARSGFLMVHNGWTIAAGNRQSRRAGQSPAALRAGCHRHLCIQHPRRGRYPQRQPGQVRPEVARRLNAQHIDIWSSR